MTTETTRHKRGTSGTHASVHTLKTNRVQQGGVKIQSTKLTVLKIRTDRLY